MAHHIATHSNPAQPIDAKTIGEQPQRRQYHPPSITEYGSLKELTTSSDMMGNKDGGEGMGVPHRT